MNLTGDKCQCPACHLYFNSTAAFDKHRVGRHGVKGERRCLSVQEMSEKGMDTNAKGYWVTAKNPAFNKED